MYSSFLSFCFGVVSGFWVLSAVSSSRVIKILDPSSNTLGSSEGRPGKGETKEGDAGGECEEELPILKGSMFLHSGCHRSELQCVSLSCFSDSEIF